MGPYLRLLMAKAFQKTVADATFRPLPMRIGMGGAAVGIDKDFDKVLLECVDETLAELLSPKVRDAAYMVLERDYSISRGEIPESPNDFSNALDQIFGVAGKTIGRAISRRLYSRLGLNFLDKPEWEFHDYIQAAKP